MDRYQPLLLVTLSLIPLWVAAAAVNYPVARVRLERFARRHHLVVTVDNGQRIVDYLVTTRRWRATGLAAGLALGLAYDLPHQRFGANVVSMLAGWFVGALIAELRLARPTTGRAGGPPTGGWATVLAVTGRVNALPVPRGVDRYLPVVASLAPLVAAATCALLALVLAVVVVLVPDTSADRVGWGRIVGPALTALAVAAVWWMMQWYVSTRTRPATANQATADLAAADDAIRSRSLHALAGGGTALVLCCGLFLAGTAAEALPELAAAVTVVNVVGAFAVPLLGWRIATSPWPVADADECSAAVAADPSRRG